MLVYLKQPMGCSTINGRRVYGKFYAYGSFGPINIPRADYFANKEILEVAVITDEWLAKKTGKVFPKVSFQTTEPYLVDFEIIKEMAGLLGMTYISSKNPTSSQQAALRRSVVRLIEAL